MQRIEVREADITRGRVGGPAYDAAYPERLKATIY